METVKPNDTGIDLADAKLPSARGLMDEPEAGAAGAAPSSVGAPIQEAELVPEVEVPSPESLKQTQIAAEDRVERRRMILTIQRYYSSERFGAFLHKMGLLEDLSNKTIDEMKGLLDEIKFCVQNRNTGNMIQRGVPQVICALEPAISPYYDIAGLGNMLMSSESFKDTLEECALASQHFSNTPPMTRLFYEVVKSAFFLHEMKAAHAVKEKVVPVSSSTADLLSSS